MCFQTFVHHACGHPKLIDAPCFLAADNPFYVKVQCPRYQHESTYPASSCGVGEYYCGRAEKDGWLLDALHLRSAEWDAAFNIACQKMTALDQHIAYFHATADRSGVSGEARWGHRGFAILSDAQQRLEDEKQHAAAEGAEVNKVIEKAKEWYRLNLLKKQMQAGPAVQPPFVPQSGLRPLELEATSPLGPAFQGIPMAAPPVYLTQQDWSILQNRQSVRQPSLLMPPSEGVSTQVDPVCRDSGNVELEAKKTMPASTGRKTLPTITPLARSGPVSNSYQAGAAKKDSGADSSSHRDRPRKKTSTSAAPVAPPAEIDMTNVRRSTRTRKKKVRYAESQGSSPSRDSSPDKKSEPAEKSASEWSELSSSPEKLQEKQGKLQRGSSGRFIKHSNRSSGESLASKIGEYQRRAGKTNGLTAGKSTMKRSVGVAGGQMATQQGAPYMSRGPTNKAWYAQPSEHYQTMLKGGAAELVAPRLGERGYLSTETTPWTADTTGGSLGRPFPDSTTAAAGVTPNNPFNSYLQQSLPGLAQPSPSQQGLAGLTRPSQSQQSLSGLSQPSQSQQSSSSQPGAQYPVPQPQKTTSGHSSHSQPDYAHDKMQSTFDVKTANGTKTYSLTVDGLDEWLSRAKAGHFKGKGGAKKSSKKQADDLNGAKMSSEGFGWDKGMTPRMKAPTSRPRISTMPGIRSQMGAGSLGYGLDPSIFAPDSGSSAAMSFGNGFQMLGGGFNEGTTSGMQMSAGIGGDGTTLQGGLQMLDKSSQRTISSYPMPAELQKSGSMYPSFNGDNGKSANFGAQTSTNGKAAGSALEGGLQSFGQRENGMKSSVQTPADSVASRMTLADALKKINEGYRENMTTPPMQTPANQSMVGLTHGGNVQMTTGGFDKDTMFSGMQTPSDSRADSVMYASDANQLSDIDPAAFFDCDRMHRSFGATHDLSPAKTPDIVVTYADMDPKKRPQPASSPTPSAKRMRLLLPAQTEQIDWSSYGLGGSNGPSHAATSSPAKMPTQRGHTTDASSSSMHPTPRLPSLSSPSADFLAPPAPIMAPDAIHLPPAQAHAVVENLEDAANLPSFGCGVEQGDGGDWSELLWDGEIDWRQVGEEGRVFGGGE